VIATAKRRVRTLAGQYLLLQVLIVLVVLVAVGAISLAQTARTFEKGEVRPALNAAENLAASPTVRQRIADAEPYDSSGLASVAESVRTVSGSTSVFLAGTDRVVLVSSDPTQVGDRFSRGVSRVLSGAAWTGTTDEEDGTVVLAEVPIYDLAGDVVGVAAIGRRVPSVWSRLGDVTPNLLVYLGVASVLGLGGSLLLSRRVKRQTLGMEPTEIARLVEHREALVHGVKEGVVALDPQQRITVVNDSARQLLQLPADSVGRRLDELDLDQQLVDVLTSRQPDPDRLVLVGDKVLAFNRRPMRSHGQVIGSVTTLRDRTELSALERELGSSRATSDTLRAQTHEFANQLHTISGLLQLEEYDEVMRFVDGVRLSRSSLYDEVTSRIADATVAALLIAKASLATERGVDLRITPDSHVGKVYGGLARDLTTVVGNLVDNALDAAATAARPQVSVRLVQDDDAILVSVRDSGSGVRDTEEVFRQGYTTKATADDAGGRGFGLALTRLVCRRRGGDVTVHNHASGGAVFTATLPTLLEAGDRAEVDA
jgi:two-component system CitB family sensor kinase